MAGQFTGMDIGGVRQLSHQLSAKAGEIEQIMHTLTSLLHHTQWVGPDRERFVDDWHSVHAVAMNNVVNGLDEAAQRAMQNANQQESVSNS